MARFALALLAVFALAAALPTLAQGPAQPSCARVSAQGSGSALGGIVSALAGLTSLTRLELTVSLKDSQWRAPPLVLPWAHIKVGTAASLRPGGATWQSGA